MATAIKKLPNESLIAIDLIQDIAKKDYNARGQVAIKHCMLEKSKTTLVKYSRLKD